MKLSKDEINRLSFLLGKARHEYITRIEFQEIRDSIFKELGHPIPTEGMLKMGNLIVGLSVIQEEFERMKANTVK